jgi:hypothetical protein
LLCHYSPTPKVIKVLIFVDDPDNGDIIDPEEISDPCISAIKVLTEGSPTSTIILFEIDTNTGSKDSAVA